MDSYLYGFTALVTLDRSVDSRDMVIDGYTSAVSEDEAYGKVLSVLEKNYSNVESIAIELMNGDVVII